jgi:hypothetical protein
VTHTLSLKLGNEHKRPANSLSQKNIERAVRNIGQREVEAGRSIALQADQKPSRFGDYGFAPRGLRRQTAAYYVGVSPTKFDEWVAQGLMPQPKQEGGVVVWDRLNLDIAFGELPDRPATAKFNPYAD